MGFGVFSGDLATEFIFLLVFLGKNQEKCSMLMFLMLDFGYSNQNFSWNGAKKKKFWLFQPITIGFWGKFLKMLMKWRLDIQLIVLVLE